MQEGGGGEEIPGTSSADNAGYAGTGLGTGYDQYDDDTNFGLLFNDPLPFGVAGASTDNGFPHNNEVNQNYVKRGEFDRVWEEREYYRKKYMEGVQQLVNMEKNHS